ncbi:hypothetical protein [Armatimonas sp.]|uniref:hypothetical protein n=1 Tax=Armatimonas sp. TaxID=1872638 RepID=UPI00375069FA
MNYDSFVKLRGVGCLALIAVPVALLLIRSNANKASVPLPREAPVSPSVGTQVPPPSESEGGSNTLSDVDREVLKMQKEPLDKGTPDAKGPKWRVKNGSVVIELRCDKDKGYTTWNRAKIDANNNKQFDETWAFKKDGTVERRVAPADDQNYTQTFVLDGEKWVAK